MLQNQAFYFATIRKITVAIGDLFNNIKVERKDSAGTVVKRIKVPLGYGSAMKYLARIKQGGSADDISVQTTLPRMAFRLLNISYDPERKLGTMKKNVFRASDGSVKTQLNPVPFNFQFEISIMSKTMDDTLSILEQILPYFTPNFTITLKEIPEMDIVKDIPVVIESISNNDNYEEGFSSLRTIIWDISLTAKGYIYPPVKDSAIIRKIITNLYTKEDMVQEVATITHSVDPIDANFEDDWDVKTTVEEPDE